MIRRLLFVALFALSTTRILAEEPLIRFADQGETAVVPASTSDDVTSDAAGNVRLAFNYDFDVDDPAGAEELPPGKHAAAECATRGFHPVCNCGCRIPPLDRWCDCFQPCCTTECWVEYPCQCSHGNCHLTDSGMWVANDAFCDVSGVPVYRSDSAPRFGWWAVDASGSPTKTGEFQDLDPSPFWDVEAISSDGERTWDIVLSGLDNEANDLHARYFGREAAAKVDFQRYLRRLDHDPLTGFDLAGAVPPGPDDNVVSEDLNVGQDYAIRVQELDAKFKGRLTKNLKWRLNVWGQRKFGERQANAVAHCFDIDPGDPPGNQNNTCHVLSQRQTIDWLTVEVQPAVEAEFENVTLEYSRTMRSFGEGDGTASRQYTHFSGFSPANDVLGPDYNYSVVPENFTQIDRLKVIAKLTENNRLYANMYVGDTKNEFRNTHRNYDGYDLRLMNDSFDDLDITAYVTRYDEENEFPSFFLTEPPLAPANTYDQDSLKHPVDYARTRAGVKGTWHPFGSPRSCYTSYGFRNGTSLVAGYEYYQLERDFAVYDTTPVPPGAFAQPDTITHQIQFGPSTRWSRSLQTYTRYKARFIDVPLIGVSEYSEDDPDIQGTFNSSLPEQVHSVEIGGTWTPASNFMTSVQFTVENSWHRSEFANFTEDNYPVVCTVWYAPTQRLSLTGGYSYFSNWIDQDITLGANRGDPNETETTRWDYAGENHLVSLNATYAWTECVQLVGGYEWNRGSNVFSLPPSPVGADWSLLPFLSDVVVETQRLTAGVDWQPYCKTDVYFRYILFDYDDLSAGRDSGISHMVLAGAAANW